MSGRKRNSLALSVMSSSRSGPLRTRDNYVLLSLKAADVLGLAVDRMAAWSCAALNGTSQSASYQGMGSCWCAYLYLKRALISSPVMKTWYGLRFCIQPQLQKGLTVPHNRVDWLQVNDAPVGRLASSVAKASLRQRRRLPAQCILAPQSAFPPGSRTPNPSPHHTWRAPAGSAGPAAATGVGGVW